MVRILLLATVFLGLPGPPLPAQISPFLRIIGLDDSLARSTPHRLRRTSDGGLLQLFNAAQTNGAGDFTGYARYDPAGQLLEVRGIEGGFGFEHRLIDLLELPDGRKVGLVQMDEDMAPASVASVSYVLKLFTPGMQEIWSVGVGGSWFSPVDYSELITDNQGNIYGAVRLGITSVGELTHRIFKVGLDGSVKWAKQLKQFPYSLALDAAGNLVMSLGPSYTSVDCFLVRITPEGAVLNSRYVKGVTVRDIQCFPAGNCCCPAMRPTRRMTGLC